MVGIWAYLFAEAMFLIKNFRLQIRDADYCSRFYLVNFCMLLEYILLVTLTFVFKGYASAFGISP